MYVNYRELTWGQNQLAAWCQGTHHETAAGHDIDSTRTKYLHQGGDILRLSVPVWRNVVFASMPHFIVKCSVCLHGGLHCEGQCLLPWQTSLWITVFASTADFIVKCRVCLHRRLHYIYVLHMPGSARWLITVGAYASGSGSIGFRLVCC